MPFHASRCTGRNRALPALELEAKVQGERVGEGRRRQLHRLGNVATPGALPCSYGCPASAGRDSPQKHWVGQVHRQAWHRAEASGGRLWSESNYWS